MRFRHISENKGINMPKVNEYYSQVEPSKLTGGSLITNPEAIANTGEQYIAGAVGHIGDLTFNLAQKEMAFNDSIASTKAVQIMKRAELDYQAKTEKDPDTNNWNKYRQETISNAQNEISKLKFGSGKGKKANDVEMRAWGDVFGSQASVQMIKQKSKDTLAATEAIFETEMKSDDGSKEAALKLNMAAEAYKKALEASYSPEVANAMIDGKTKLLLIKRTKDRALQIATNLRDDTGMIDLKQAQTFIESHEGLNADSKLEVLKKVNDWDAQEKINLENSWLNAKGKFEADAQKMLSAGKFTELINQAETFDAGVKGKFLSEQVKLKDEYIKLARGGLSGKENIDNQIVIDGLNQKAFSVYSGDSKRDDFIKEVNKEFYLKHNITPKTRDELFAKMDNPLTAEQSKIVEDYVKDTRQQIIAQSSGGMTMDLGGGQTYTIRNPGQSDAELANRLKWVNLYERALTKYVIQNAGDTGAKFRDYADDLRIYYTNANYKEIQTEIAKSEKKKPTENVRVKMPDGKIWDIPKDKVSVAIERGGVQL